MPVYSLYSFHRTFIPGFEYLTPSGLVQVDNFLSRINLLKCLLFFYCHPSRCQFIVYTLFTELLSQVSSTWPHCGPIQLVDHVLVRKDFWIFWITSHMFSAPFSLLLLYHKKQWKRNRNPGIYKGFQTWYRMKSPSVSVGWHRCFTRSFRRLECLWLFDFKPGHEPVELLPGQLFYFQLISGPAESALDLHTFI